MCVGRGGGELGDESPGRQPGGEAETAGGARSSSVPVEGGQGFECQQINKYGTGRESTIHFELSDTGRDKR